MVIADRRSRRTGRAQGGAALPVRAWAAATVLAAVPVVLTAQHAAGGGNPHPRYLLPAVPVLAAAVALAVVRLTTRWGAVVLLAALAALTASQAQASIRALDDAPAGPAGSPLATAAGAPWVQGAGVAVAVLGLALLLAAIARRTTGDDADRSAPAAAPA